MHARENRLATWVARLTLIALAAIVPADVVAQLAPTPPMGWNSWNHYGAKVNDADVRAAADAMSTNGMREAGYLYINVDDGWQGTRDKTGELHPNANFPDMEALAAYVHSKGLKFGIYTTPGSISCAHFEGSQGHETQDAAMFARWKVDLVKYDACSFRDTLKARAGGDPELARTMLQQAYEKMHAAILATGRPMVLSMSQHGMTEVWKWAAQVGAQMWRTGDDVRPTYESLTGIGFAQAGLSAYAGVGHWNDPDMLEVCNGKLTDDESRTQMSLWALLAAPLIAGNDLAAMSPKCREILTNADVIAVDQDRAGRQGDRVWAEGPIEIWSRVLADRSLAVGIFNRNQGANYVELDLARLGLPDVASARDLWAHKDFQPIAHAKSFLVSGHGVLLLELYVPRRDARERNQFPSHPAATMGTFHTPRLVELCGERLLQTGSAVRQVSVEAGKATRPSWLEPAFGDSVIEVVPRAVFDSENLAAKTCLDSNSRALSEAGFST